MIPFLQALKIFTVQSWRDWQRRCWGEPEFAAVLIRISIDATEACRQFKLVQDQLRSMAIALLALEGR